MCVVFVFISLLRFSIHLFLCSALSRLLLLLMLLLLCESHWKAILTTVNRRQWQFRKHPHNTAYKTDQHEPCRSVCARAFVPMCECGELFSFRQSKSVCASIEFMLCIPTVTFILFIRTAHVYVCSVCNVFFVPYIQFTCKWMTRSPRRRRCRHHHHHHRCWAPELLARYTQHQTTVHRHNILSIANNGTEPM